MEPVLVALIVAIPAMFTPIVLALVANRSRRQEKQEDYARQDTVAARLLAANERVAKTASETSAQLKVIHTLVNSNMTAEMQENLDSKKIALALMLELIELKKAAGIAASEEVLLQVGVARGKIAELEAQLADRLKQSDEIARRQNQDMVANMRNAAPL